MKQRYMLLKSMTKPAPKRKRTRSNPVTPYDHWCIARAKLLDRIEGRPGWRWSDG